MRAVGGFVAVCAALFAVAVQAAYAAFPGENGRIALTREDHQFSPARSDVYTVLSNGAGTMRLTTSGDGRTPAWSGDGTRIAFVDDGDLVTADEDGTHRQLVLDSPGYIVDIAWSPTGERLAFTMCSNPFCFSADRPDVYTVSLDGSGLQNLTATPVGNERAISWSPDGQRIAFDFRTDSTTDVIKTMRPDGSDLTTLQVTGPASAYTPDWSPDGLQFAFYGNSQQVSGNGVHLVSSAGGAAQTISVFVGDQPAWSPDGQHIVLRGIRVIDADGTDATIVTSPGPRYSDSDPDWQPVPQPQTQPPLPGPGYPRPLGASPLRVSLVPAYAECTSPNREHGSPLAFGSCGPPVRTSQPLTVGTPDANGRPAQLTASITLNTQAGTFGRPEDAFVQLSAAINDVYWNAGCAGPPCDLEPYVGDLEGSVSLRMTDRLNTGGPAESEPATVTDASFTFPLQCAFVSGGSTRCDVNTDVNAIVPGLVRERRRAIWELNHVRVLDAGPDGSLATTGDQSTFLRQGIFVP